MVVGAIEIEADELQSLSWSSCQFFWRCHLPQLKPVLEDQLLSVAFGGDEWGQELGPLLPQSSWVLLLGAS